MAFSRSDIFARIRLRIEVSGDTTFRYTRCSTVPYVPTDDSLPFSHRSRFVLIPLFADGTGEDVCLSVDRVASLDCMIVYSNPNFLGRFALGTFSVFAPQGVLMYWLLNVLVEALERNS